MDNAATLAAARGARGGAGLTTTPSYIATGTVGDGTEPSTTQPSYGTNEAGDAFILQLVTRQESVAPGTITGFTLKGDYAISAFARVRWYMRDTRSTGGESGSITITDCAAVVVIAAIHTFRNVSVDPIAFYEGASTLGQGSVDDTIEAPTVTANGAHRLALAIGGATEDLTIDSFTGETGGNWTLAHTHPSTTGTDACSWLQTAALSSGGTISGGSITVASAEEWSEHGLALVGV